MVGGQSIALGSLEAPIHREVLLDPAAFAGGSITTQWTPPPGLVLEGCAPFQSPEVYMSYSIQLPSSKCEGERYLGGGGGRDYQCYCVDEFGIPVTACDSSGWYCPYGTTGICRVFGDGPLTHNLNPPATAPENEPGETNDPEPSGGGGTGSSSVPDSITQGMGLGTNAAQDQSLGRITWNPVLDENAPLNFEQVQFTGAVSGLSSEFYTEAGVRRQVLATAALGTTASGATLVDIIPLDPMNLDAGYVITSYDVKGLSIPSSGTPFAPSADRMISRVTVQKASITIGSATIHGVRVTTEKRGEAPSIVSYYAAPSGGGSGTWIVVDGTEGSVVTDPGYSTPPGGGSEERTVQREGIRKDADGNDIVVSFVQEKYVKMEGQERLIEKVEGANGQKVTKYSYYDDEEDLTRYGKLHIVLNPDGSWTRTFYDTYGEVSELWEPWLDAGATTIAGIEALTRNQCKVRQIERFPARAEGVAYTPPTKTTTTTFVLGAEVSRQVVSKRTVYDGFTGLSVNETLSQTFAVNGTLLSESRSGRTVPMTETSPTRAVYSARLDGTRTTYEGPEGGGPGTYVTTEGTISQPAGIPRKSLQTVSIQESDGNSSEETRVALGGGSYATVSTRATDEDTSTGDFVRTTTEDGIVVDVTTVESDGITTSVDAAGVTTVSTTNALTGTRTVTRLGGDPITIAPYGELHDGSDLSIITSTHARTAGPGGVPRGSIERVRRVTGAQSRTESETEVDEVGDPVRSTDVYGRTTHCTYGTSAGGGRVITETGPGGVTRISTYYRDGRLKSLTGSGVVAQYYTYEWNAQRELVTTVRTGNAQSPRWQRTISDGAGRTLREEKPAFGGNGITRTEYVYNTKGQRVQVLRTGLAAQVYEYDDAGNLFRQGIDLNGDGVLNLTGSPDPVTESSASYEQIGGLWWQVSQSRQYFGDGTNAAAFRKTEQRRALGLGPNQAGITIDATGRQTITTTAYDRANRTVKSVSFVNEVPNTSEVVESTTINGLTVLQTSSISSDRTTVLKYDAFQRLTSQSGPAGSFGYGYDGNLDRLSVQGQNSGSTSLVTFYTYFGPDSASAGQVESIVAPASVLSPGTQATTYHEYDVMGRLTGKWGNGTYPVRYRYDELGDRVEMWTYRTDTIGTGAKPWVKGEYTPSTFASVTRWIYDLPSGFLKGKRDAADKGASYEYGASGLLAQRTWARTVGGSPLTTAYQYDGAGRLTTTNYSDTTPDATFSYYRDGALRQVIDGAGLRTFDRLSGVGTATRERIAGGGSGANLLEGLVVERPVDAHGRKKSFSGRFTIPSQAAVPLPVVSYAYQDGWVGATPPGEIIAWNYAGSPEMRFVRGTNYDGASKRHKVTIERSFGGAASFKSTTETDIALGTVQVSHQYGSAAAFQSRTRTGNQIDQVDPDITTWPTAVPAYERWTYGTDTRGQIGGVLKSASYTPGSTYLSYLSQWGSSYSYDDIGNRKADSFNAGSNQYTTNALNQYISISHPREFILRGASPTDSTVTVNGQATDRQGIHFTKVLQAGGNGPRWENVEIEASRTVSGTPHTVAQTGKVYVPPASEVLTYDADGNLTSDGRWNYTWDGENRLIGMSTNSADVTAGVPQVSLAFAYDYRSRRIAKTVSKYVTAESAWRTTSDLRFVYEGWNLMAEVELLAEQAPGATGQAGVSPRLFRSFVWGPDVSGTWEGAGSVGGLLGMTRHQRAGQAAASYMATSDLNGNVIGLYGSNGKLALYDYDSFGQVLRANEPEEYLNPFRFSTKYQDVETDIAYYGYRYYDMARGRWVNRDPIDEEGGLGLYGFVVNNPVSFIDIDGRQIFPPSGSSSPYYPPYLPQTPAPIKPNSPAAATEYQDAMAALASATHKLKSALEGYCPKEGESICHTANQFRPKSAQTCTRASCMEQALRLSSAMAQKAAEVLSQQWENHQKMTNFGGDHGGNSVADEANKQGGGGMLGGGGGCNPGDESKGLGLKCFGWQAVMAQVFDSTMSQYGVAGSLCFRGAGVGHRVWPAKHAWFHIYGVGNFDIKPSNQIIVIDPWMSGGRELIPSNPRTATWLNEELIYWKNESN